MRRSKALAKFRNGEAAKFCCLGHFVPSFICQAAHFGFDAIWLDLEHRCFSEREVQSLLAYFHQYDIDCMLRPPTLEFTRLYRYLEDGATGLMIPHVSTPEKAKELVQAVKFPPIGNRGLDGAGMDCDFMINGGPDYPAEANRETFLVVQIETPEAVENADAIAAVEGVDGLFVGPGDLGLRIKHLEDDDLTLEKADQIVAEAAKKHGKAWGRPCFSLDHMKEVHGMGAQILNHGGDFMAMKNMLEECSENFKKVL